MKMLLILLLAAVGFAAILMDPHRQVLSATGLLERSSPVVATITRQLPLVGADSKIVYSRAVTATNDDHVSEVDVPTPQLRVISAPIPAAHQRVRAADVPVARCDGSIRFGLDGRAYCVDL